MLNFAIENNAIWDILTLRPSPNWTSRPSKVTIPPRMRTIAERDKLKGNLCKPSSIARRMMVVKLTDLALTQLNRESQPLVGNPFWN